MNKNAKKVMELIVNCAADVDTLTEQVAEAGYTLTLVEQTDPRVCSYANFGGTRASETCECALGCEHRYCQDGIIRDHICGEYELVAPDATTIEISITDSCKGDYRLTVDGETYILYVRYDGEYCRIVDYDLAVTPEDVYEWLKEYIGKDYDDVSGELIGCMEQLEEPGERWCDYAVLETDDNTGDEILYIDMMECDGPYFRIKTDDYGYITEIVMEG